jgi:hypothetical protein
MNKPALTESLNLINFQWTDGILVELHHLHDSGKAQIWARYLENKNGTPWTTEDKKNATLLDVSEINLMAPRSRTEYCNHLKTRSPGLDFDWQAAFSFIVPMALQAQQLGEPVIELGKPGVEIKRPEWDAYPFVVRGMINLIFGDRGSLKSKFTLLLALIMMLPLSDNKLGIIAPARSLSILKLDFEATNDADEYEWRRLLRGLDLEGAVQLNYRDCRRRTLVDDIDTISYHADAVKADVLIVDSLGPAAGGNLNDSEPALKLNAALRQLNRTVIMPAHTAKNQLGKRSVYGNVFYENLARNIWEVNKEEDEDSESPTQHIAMHQTKSPPFAPHHRDMAFEFDFDQDAERTIIRSYDPDKMDVVNEKKTNPTKILSVLKGKTLLIKEIAEETGVSESVVKTTLYRMKESQKVVKLGEEWGIAYRDHE